MAKDGINKVKRKRKLYTVFCGVIRKFIQHFWSYLFNYGPDTVVRVGNKTLNKVSACLTSRIEWGIHTEQVPLSVMNIIKVKSGCHGKGWHG